jgi:hypothetical protein
MTTSIHCFDASFVDRDHGHIWENYGNPWSKRELEQLVELYRKDLTLHQMCHALGRPASGVVAKLEQTRCIRKTNYGAAYGSRANYERCKVAAPSTSTLPATSEAPAGAEETTMSEKTIETRVLIQGQNAAEMSDKQIFSLIAKLEKEIKAMSEIERKPKKLVAAIDQIKADIDKLVEYVDSREEVAK